MTMSEVLIAAVLLSFVVMGGITALSQSYGHIRHARMVTLAGQVLQSVMEDLRLNNYSQLKAYAAQSQPVNLTAMLSSERFHRISLRVFQFPARSPLWSHPPPAVPVRFRRS
jgi:Tfp pilus assembly protein PilV